MTGPPAPSSIKRRLQALEGRLPDSGADADNVVNIDDSEIQHILDTTPEECVDLLTRLPEPDEVPPAERGSLAGDYFDLLAVPAEGDTAHIREQIRERWDVR